MIGGLSLSDSGLTRFPLPVRVFALAPLYLFSAAKNLKGRELAQASLGNEVADLEAHGQSAMPRTHRGHEVAQQPEGSDWIVTSKRIIKTPAELSREVLAKAEAVKIERDQGHVSAVARAEELRAQLASGDESVSSSDLVNADAEVERASLLAVSAETGVKRATRDLVNDDTSLAEIFTAAVSEAVGMKATATALVPKPNADRTPALHVVQLKPSTVKGGIVSGELDVRYYRDALHAELNAQKVEEAGDLGGGFNAPLCNLHAAQTPRPTEYTRTAPGSLCILLSTKRPFSPTSRAPVQSTGLAAFSAVACSTQ